MMIELVHHSNGTNNSRSVVSYLTRTLSSSTTTITTNNNNTTTATTSTNNTTTNTGSTDIPVVVSSSSSVAVVVYASHCIINIYQPTNYYNNTTNNNVQKIINNNNNTPDNNNNNDDERCNSNSSNTSIVEPLMWSIDTTLRTSIFDNNIAGNSSTSSGSGGGSGGDVSLSLSSVCITCLSTISVPSSIPISSLSLKQYQYPTIQNYIISGFSNGNINVWIYHPIQYIWKEYIITSSSTIGNSITAIDATIILTPNNNENDTTTTEAIVVVGRLYIVAGTSTGCYLYECIIGYNTNNTNTTNTNNNDITCTVVQKQSILDNNIAIATIKFSEKYYYQYQQQQPQSVSLSDSIETTTPTTPTTTPVSSPSSSPLLLLFIGTAIPVHNKIHVYTLLSLLTPSAINDSLIIPSTKHRLVQYHGYLSGHEDWITSVDYRVNSTTTNNNNKTNQVIINDDIDGSNAAVTTSSISYLATASQDGRIRLWKFKTISTIATTSPGNVDNNTTTTNDLGDDNSNEVNSIDNNNNNNNKYDIQIDNNDIDNNDIDDEIDDEEEEEGESRLEIITYGNRNNNNKDGTIIKYITTVTFDALLLGHEESITAVSWHPNPYPLYGIDLVLVSSSMDRTILIWAESTSTSSSNALTKSSIGGAGTGTGTGNGGVWTPIQRVGSAGGILGGSIGSSLLGFLNIIIDPITGTTLLGHAYGGSIHVWSLDNNNNESTTTTNNKIIIKSTNNNNATDNTGDAIMIDNNNNNDNEITTATTLSLEDRVATMIQWKSRPCITGHYKGVSDLVWDTHNGSYLLTVSYDQTCRLWVPIDTGNNNNDGTSNNNKQSSKSSSWIELIRPQVHGYDIQTITCISTSRYPHRICTGSDEKEIRVFHAPQTTIRLLQAVIGNDIEDDPISQQRVERAYIPSLGLSNKASAVDAAAIDDEGILLNDDNTVIDVVEMTATSMTDDSKTTQQQQQRNLGRAVIKKLPLERDLGAVLLWPEIQKLYGHDTELYCLTSTCESGSAVLLPTQVPPDTPAPTIYIASAGKARDVPDAAIRIWTITDNNMTTSTGSTENTTNSIVCTQILQGGHKATIATMSFSASGLMLVSSGKDRRICLWIRRCPSSDDDGTTSEYVLGWKKESAHKRIIWSIHFCPVNENIFASGSRDGCIKIWNVVSTTSSNTEPPSIQVQELYSFAPSYIRSNTKKPDSVTAVAFAPILLKGGGGGSSNQSNEENTSNELLLLAIGLESGRIELWTIPNYHQTAVVPGQQQPQLVQAFDDNISHIATITKLAWRPYRPKTSSSLTTTLESDNFVQLQLASASLDHGCRIYTITLSHEGSS